MLDGVEITIDEWPFLDPLVEVEGRDESEVRAVSEKLGFKWSDAKFCPAGEIYVEKYGVTPDRINNHTPRLVFGDPNPFT
jgi:adenylate cyclase class 2